MDLISKKSIREFIECHNEAFGVIIRTIGIDNASEILDGDFDLERDDLFNRYKELFLGYIVKKHGGVEAKFIKSTMTTEATEGDVNQVLFGLRNGYEGEVKGAVVDIILNELILELKEYLK